MEHGPARFLRRGDLVRAREQQHYQAHQEANPDLLERRRELWHVQA
jgi:hypothetical protein